MHRLLPVRNGSTSYAYGIPSRLVAPPLTNGWLVGLSTASGQDEKGLPVYDGEKTPMVEGDGEVAMILGVEQYALPAAPA